MFKTGGFILLSLTITLTGKAQDLGKLQPFQETQQSSGEIFDSNNLKGKIVLINFWAVWCPPCIEELPYLQKVHEKYKDEPKVEILAIHCTISRSREEVSRFIEKQNLSLPFIYDDDCSVRDSIGSGGIPRNYLINKDGEILKEIDDRPHDTFVQRVSKEIDNLLNQQ